MSTQLNPVRRSLGARSLVVLVGTAALVLGLLSPGAADAATRTNFSLRVTPTVVTLPAGDKALSQIVISRTSKFRSRVSISLVGLPVGITVASSSATSTRVTFTLSAAANTRTSRGLVRVVGKGGGLTRETAFTLQINCNCPTAPAVTAPPAPAPTPTTPAAPSVGDFAVTIDPANVTLTAGDSSRHAIFVNGTGGFNSTVRFELKGLPANTRAAFVPEFSKNGTTLLLVTTITTPRGDYPLTVNAIDGARVRSVPMTLSVRTGADFSIQASASTINLVPGGATTLTATVAPLTTAAVEVDLTVSGLPVGGTVTPVTSRTSGTTSFQLVFPTTAAAAVYRVTVTGTSGSFVKSAFVDITVQPVVSILLSPSAASAPKGSPSTFTITLSATAGTGTPALVVTALPPSSSATLLINADGSRFLQVTTSAATPAGTYPVSVTAQAGTVQVTSTAQLTVQ